MLKLNRALVPAFAALALAPIASAQNFNIDFGNASPLPSSAFGAASGQIGFWNTYLSSPTNNLTDVAGNSTSVNLTATNAFATFASGFNDPLTLGNDEALMDDYIAITFIETYSLTNLAAGTYNVYTYTWTFGPLSTGINVNATGQQIIGGTWTGGYLLGTTHALHTVTVPANGTINIRVVSIDGALGAISGVQIVQVPSPAGASVLALGALAMTRRRR
jgi:hypothetical protein